MPQRADGLQVHDTSESSFHFLLLGMAGRPSASPKKCQSGRCTWMVRKSDGRRAYEAGLCKRCWRTSTRRSKAVSKQNLLKGRTTQVGFALRQLALPAIVSLPGKANAMAPEASETRSLLPAITGDCLQTDTSCRHSSPHPAAERWQGQRAQPGNTGIVPVSGKTNPCRP